MLRFTNDPEISAKELLGPIPSGSLNCNVLQVLLFDSSA